jgi:hypothetical protein
MPVTTNARTQRYIGFVAFPPTRYKIVLCAESCDNGKLTGRQHGYAVAPVGDIKLLTLNRGCCVM